MMLGAIIGAYIGSQNEYLSLNSQIKSKNFTLFSKECTIMSDIVLTVATAEALLKCNGNYNKLADFAAQSYISAYQNNPNLDYGKKFTEWALSKNRIPYNSYGNAAAMKITPVGYISKSIDEAVKLSKTITEITHNHPEGIKGAEAVSAAIFLARSGKKINEIREYIDSKYYKMDINIASIRDSLGYDVTCQGTVPYALLCFFESTSYEDAIRNAVSLGGDSATIACICGAVAGAYYNIPQYMIDRTMLALNKEQVDICNKFEQFINRKYSDAVYAEAGDEVEVSIANQRHKITIPNEEVCNDFNLSFYNALIGRYVSEEFVFNNKQYTVKSIIKSDVETQHNQILQALVKNLNTIFGFNFFGCYFSDYVGDSYKIYTPESKQSDALITLADNYGSLLYKNIMGEKYDLLNEDERFEVLHIFNTPYEDYERDDICLECIASDLFYDLSDSLRNMTTKLDFLNFDNDMLQTCAIYAEALSKTSKKLANPFGSNIWNIPNTILFTDYLKGEPFVSESFYIQDIDRIDKYSFSMTVHRRIALAPCVKKICEGAFSHSDYLVNVVFEEGSAEVIGKYAFHFCGIRQLLLPKSTARIEQYAFAHCYRLFSVIIPENVEEIGDYAFAHCSNLETVVILGENTIISPTAFEGCTKLSIEFYKKSEVKTEICSQLTATQDKTCEISSDVNPAAENDIPIIKYDIVAQPYQIKYNKTNCPYCKAKLDSNKCIYNGQLRSLFTDLLYCSGCHCYFTNNLVSDNSIIQAVGRPHVKKTNITRRTHINFDKCYIVPPFPEQIQVFDVCGRQIFANQIVNKKLKVKIEIISDFAELISEILIDNDPVNMPCVLNIHDLQKLSLTLNESHKLKLDYSLESLIVKCGEAIAVPDKLYTDGTIISVSKNESSTHREINEVLINDEIVQLPYEFPLKTDTIISVKYYTCFYVFVENELDILINGSVIKREKTDSKGMSKYYFNKPTVISVYAKKSSIDYVDSFLLNSEEYPVPSRLCVTEQCTIKANRHSYKLIINYNTNNLIVRRNSIKIISGTKIYSGETLSVGYIVDPNRKFKHLLCNGEIIKCPGDILVKNSDIVLECIYDDTIRIASSEYADKPKHFRNIVFIHNGNLRCFSNHHNTERSNISVETMDGSDTQLNVGHCLDCNEYFISEPEYDRYLNRYKILLLHLVYTPTGTFTLNTEKMASKSPLNLCGYNVNKISGFSEGYRQSVLKAVIDKNILSKNEVMNYLSLFISMNGKKSGNEDAVLKWANDLKFVKYHC